VRKSVRDSFGVPRTLEVMAVVKGVVRVQRAVDDLTKHLTQEEKKSGIFFCLGIHVESDRLRMNRIGSTPTRNPVGHKWHALTWKVMQSLSGGRYVANVVGIESNP
jgi:hypothetical protein